MNQPANPDNPYAIIREGGQHVESLMGKLRESYDFFSDMSQNEMIRFLRLCSRRSFDVGELVFSQGEIGDCFYLIVYGEITIEQNDVEIGRLGPGQCFGEMAILESAPRSASAIAVAKTLVFCVEREILTDVFPSLGFKVASNLARDLSRKLRETDDRLKQREQSEG